MYEMMSEAVCPLLASLPARYARIKGSDKYPKLEGMVFFHRFREGTVVVADIVGLPATESNIFGFHIHEGSACIENETDSFADTGGHFNPYEKEHPMHAGDMPVLFANKGRAWSAFYTERFLPGEVATKTVVIHDMPDDFRTNPAGASGEKIACGKIV